MLEWMISTQPAVCVFRCYFCFTGVVTHCAMNYHHLANSSLHQWHPRVATTSNLMSIFYIFFCSMIAVRTQPSVWSWTLDAAVFQLLSFPSSRLMPSARDVICNDIWTSLPHLQQHRAVVSWRSIRQSSMIITNETTSYVQSCVPWHDFRNHRR